MTLPIATAADLENWFTEDFTHEYDRQLSLRVSEPIARQRADARANRNRAEYLLDFKITA